MGLLVPLPVTKAVPSCWAKAIAHLLGDPLVDVDGAVVEQRRGRGRHGVELHGREGELGERRRVGLGTRGGLGDPAGSAPVMANGFL